MNSSSEDSRSSRSHKHRHTSKSKDKKSHHHRDRSRHHHSTKKKSKESKHRSKDSEKSKKEIKKSKEKSHTHHSKHSSYRSDHSSKGKSKNSSSSSSSNHKNYKEELSDKNNINMIYLKKNMFFPAMNPPQFKIQNIPNLNHSTFPNNLMNVQNINNMNAVMMGMNNNEGFNDKIVKDQNFLNSEEKLFDNIVSHEMSLKNLFSDCQFSEKYLGNILYRTIKKQTFDSNIVIFDEREDDDKKFVIPKQSEFIQKKIENLKINTQKVKFEGLGNIYKKIIDERRSEIEKENNNIKSNKNNE
jgi:hypothetical protein